MIFASIRVSQIPWRSGQRVKLHATTLNGKQASVVVRDLRQHNEPNPILMAFRADREDDVTPRERVLWWLAYGIDHYSTATDAQCDHARHVLTRLADLEVTK